MASGRRLPSGRRQVAAAVYGLACCCRRRHRPEFFRQSPPRGELALFNVSAGEGKSTRSLSDGSRKGGTHENERNSAGFGDKPYAPVDAVRLWVIEGRVNRSRRLDAPGRRLAAKDEDCFARCVVEEASIPVVDCGRATGYAGDIERD